MRHSAGRGHGSTMGPPPRRPREGDYAGFDAATGQHVGQHARDGQPGQRRRRVVQVVEQRDPVRAVEPASPRARPPNRLAHEGEHQEPRQRVAAARPRPGSSAMPARSAGSASPRPAGRPSARRLLDGSAGSASGRHARRSEPAPRPSPARQTEARHVTDHRRGQDDAEKDERVGLAVGSDRAGRSTTSALGSGTPIAPIRTVNPATG